VEVAEIEPPSNLLIDLILSYYKPIHSVICELEAGIELPTTAPISSVSTHASDND
jgi:hypothetical protein